jgi:hypothetical protein
MSDTGKWVLIVAVAGLAACNVYLLVQMIAEWIVRKIDLDRGRRVMLRRFGIFLIGCLVIVIVVYVLHLMIGMLGLPADIAQFAFVIVALLALLALVYLAWQAFWGSPPP